MALCTPQPFSPSALTVGVAHVTAALQDAHNMGIIPLTGAPRQISTPVFDERRTS